MDLSQQNSRRLHCIASGNRIAPIFSEERLFSKPYPVARLVLSQRLATCELRYIQNTRHQLTRSHLTVTNYKVPHQQSNRRRFERAFFYEIHYATRGAHDHVAIAILHRHDHFPHVRSSHEQSVLQCGFRQIALHTRMYGARARKIQRA